MSDRYIRIFKGTDEDKRKELIKEAIAKKVPIYK